MKQVRRRGSKPLSSELYGKISHSVSWVMVMFLTLISYFAETRSFISSSFGIYLVGLLDGTLMTISAASAIFYLRSKIDK
jgi:hypothetical protein